VKNKKKNKNYTTKAIDIKRENIVESVDPPPCTRAFISTKKQIILAGFVIAALTITSNIEVIV
jgi:hypothetical protein